MARGWLRIWSASGAGIGIRNGSFQGLRCDWKLMKEPPHVRARSAKTPMSESSVQGAFRLALAQSGISKPATPHTLRHSYATHLLEEGVSIRLISQYLGHSSLDITVIYTHLTACTEERTREHLEKLHSQTSGRGSVGAVHAAMASNLLCFPIPDGTCRRDPSHGPAYLPRHGAQMPTSHRAAFEDILRCHTPEAVGSVYGCGDCGHRHFVYHSHVHYARRGAG